MDALFVVSRLAHGGQHHNKYPTDCQYPQHLPEASDVLLMTMTLLGKGKDKPTGTGPRMHKNEGEGGGNFSALDSKFRDMSSTRPVQ